MMSDENKRIFELIDLERKERRTDIAEIHNRIDQILDAVNRLSHKPTQANAPILALFATVVLSLGTILQIQVLGVDKSSRERYERSNAHIEEVEKLADVQLNSNKRYIEKMIDWQNEHDLRVRGINSAQTQRIKGLEREVFGLNYFITESPE